VKTGRVFLGLGGERSFTVLRTISQEENARLLG
jgi:hypothetical protein